jgi:hypothetical protein
MRVKAWITIDVINRMLLSECDSVDLCLNDFRGCRVYVYRSTGPVIRIIWEETLRRSYVLKAVIINLTQDLSTVAANEHIQASGFLDYQFLDGAKFLYQKLRRFKRLGSDWFRVYVKRAKLWCGRGK